MRERACVREKCSESEADSSRLTETNYRLRLWVVALSALRARRGLRFWPGCG